MQKAVPISILACDAKRNTARCRIRLGLVFMMPALIFLACAHRELHLPKSPPLSSNAAQVNIIRDSRFFAFGVALMVTFDEADLCNLRAGEYVTFEVESGFHALGLSESTIRMPFAPMRKYYFLIKASSDNFGFEIERLDEGFGRHMIAVSELLE
jgi:hypothetical protein